MGIRSREPSKCCAWTNWNHWGEEDEIGCHKKKKEKKEKEKAEKDLCLKGVYHLISERNLIGQRNSWGCPECQSGIFEASMRITCKYLKLQRGGGRLLGQGDIMILYRHRDIKLFMVLDFGYHTCQPLRTLPFELTVHDQSPPQP